MLDFGIEKLVRDAAVFLHMDATVDISRSRSSSRCPPHRWNLRPDGELAMRIPVFFFLFFSIASVLAQGDAYPTRPVRIVVAVTPGSVNRHHGAQRERPLAAAFGQPVVVENRPGAGRHDRTGWSRKSAAEATRSAVVSAGSHSRGDL